MYVHCTISVVPQAPLLHQDGILCLLELVDCEIPQSGRPHCIAMTARARAVSELWRREREAGDSGGSSRMLLGGAVLRLGARGHSLMPSGPRKLCQLDSSALQYSPAKVEL